MEAGDVTVQSDGLITTQRYISGWDENDEPIYSTRVYASGAAGVQVYSSGSSDADFSVKAGDVTVDLKTGEDPEGYMVTETAYGVSAQAYSPNTEITVEVGDVTVTAENAEKNITTFERGVNAQVNGATVQAEFGSITAEGVGEGVNATGLRILASDTTYYDVDNNPEETLDASASVTVLGDVTANGETGTGIFVQNSSGEVSIVVDGTVSGSTDSIVLLGSQSVNGNKQAEFDNAGTSLTVWAAEENKDGHVATVVDRNIIPGNENNPAPTITDTVNEEATKAVEAAINYIVKIGTDFLKQITASGEKGKTVTVSGATYATANEGEDVNVSVKLDEDKEVLEGVYYNEDDETSLTKAEDLKKDSEGGFLMKMLRGGAMMLGLKIHTHSYDTYVYNNDATCTADCTKTAKCVRCDVTDTVADTNSKTGHTPGDAVQENYYAAGPGYSGSYDLVVYCDVCGQEISRNTIFIPAEPVEEPAAPAPKTHLELVYEPVDDTAEQNGVVIAEHPEMEETFQIVLETLQQDEEITKITISAMEEALTEEQAQVFDSLTIQEQLTLTLCALGYSENQDTLSDSGAQLLAEISGNQEVLDAILAQFPVEEETIDGEVREVIKIEILIEKDGVASFQRYYFFKSEGVWKLFKIENGVYVEVRD